MISSKSLIWVFLIFCRSRFLNNFIAKNISLEPYNQMLNISRPICIKKHSAHFFKICKNRWNCFFQTEWETTNLGVSFLHKEIILYFLSVII